MDKVTNRGWSQDEMFPVQTRASQLAPACISACSLGAH